jgi:branched-chain amino acid transport system ATP-binding protein
MTPSKTKELALKIEDVSIAFGGLKAVDNLSFAIERHEIFGLIGPNGAGKTTIFNCITQFYKADSGSIHFINAK